MFGHCRCVRTNWNHLSIWSYQRNLAWTRRAQMSINREYFAQLSVCVWACHAHVWSEKSSKKYEIAASEQQKFRIVKFNFQAIHSIWAFPVLRCSIKIYAIHLFFCVIFSCIFHMNSEAEQNAISKVHFCYFFDFVQQMSNRWAFALHLHPPGLFNVSEWIGTSVFVIIKS